MRLVFLVLLLINLLLLGWMQGYLGAGETGREPERLSRQIEPDALRIVTPRAGARKSACKRLEGLSADEARSLSDAVQVHDGWESRTVPVAGPPQHWVAISELPNRATAEKKQAELRQLGVADSEIVEAAGSYSVSLGLFRDASRADSYLQGLSARGVRSARILTRPAPEMYAVELRAATEELATTLPGLHAALPRAALLDCAAP